MDDKELLDASCRVALGAYLHDLGKFVERANTAVPAERLETHLQMYCPRQEAGGRVWYTHRHAAYTALAWDLLENKFPELVGEAVFPFAAWGAPDVDDSLVNVAARHHKPDTFLQWVVATADRVASGFEREEFEKYNAAEDKTREGRSHYTARLLTLFEQIHPEGADRAVHRGELDYRYPLKPMSVKSLFPVLAKGYESHDNATGQGEYKELWDAFESALDLIPASHRQNWSLWLDHFDSAWACFTHAIPSATAFNIRPEVSLYDHSRATAGLATALWRYHHERGDDPTEIREKLATYGRPDWEEQKFLLIQGDFFGIQDFLFATGSETQKRAARLLRGRSFYVSLLTECAALKVLDKLALPPTSQVINAAGKFLIVAPNTPETIAGLEAVQREFDDWFLEQSYGQAGMGLAWLPAACNDFLKGGEAGRSRFGGLMDRLFAALNDAKARRFNLCADGAPTPIFAGFLDRFNNDLGVCAVDGRSPATTRLDGGDTPVSALAADQIDVGRLLSHNERVLISRGSLSSQGLRIPVFGYHIFFTGGEEASGRFGAEAARGNLRRAWDYSRPESEEGLLFKGYGRRAINGYVPLFGEPNAWERGRYHGLKEDAEDYQPFEPKTLNHIACDDRVPDERDKYAGVTALTTLKGDVDNLGRIFERGLRAPTFAKMAGLSRQMNAFFAVWLPWYCDHKVEFRSTYTVFAGGDDFFLIGPWRSTLLLARDMRKHFREFVAGNPDIHFSAGLSMTKPGMPVRQMGELAEKALDAAKDRTEGGRVVKNAVTCFGHTVSWDEFEGLLELALQLEDTRTEVALPMGYLYDLQYLADMAEDLRRGTTATGEGPKVESALWNSRFVYRTWRMLERRRGLSADARRRLQGELGTRLGGAIARHGAAFKIALFTHLYRYRQ